MNAEDAKTILKDIQGNVKVVITCADCGDNIDNTKHFEVCKKKASTSSDATKPKRKKTSPRKPDVSPYKKTQNIIERIFENVPNEFHITPRKITKTRDNMLISIRDWLHSVEQTKSQQRDSDAARTLCALKKSELSANRIMVLIKPKGVRNKLISNIIELFEGGNFKLLAMRFICVSIF